MTSWTPVEPRAGDPALKGNLTRRVDFARFMIDALKNDDCFTSPRRLSAARSSALAHFASD